MTSLSTIDYEVGSNVDLTVADIDYEKTIQIGEENKVIVQTREIATKAKIYMNVTNECEFDTFDRCVKTPHRQKLITTSTTKVLKHVGHGRYEGLYTIKAPRVGAFSLVLYTLQNGLIGNVYRNKEFDGLPAKVVHDRTINYDWRREIIHGVRYDDLSIRWVGQLITPESRSYKFKVRFDDDLRIFIDGQVKADFQINNGGPDRTFEVYLSQGAHDFVVEFVEVSGSALVHLYWEHPVGSGYLVLGEQFLRSTNSALVLDIEATCRENTYLNKNKNECARCPPGQCQPKSGKTSCEKCKA